MTTSMRECQQVFAADGASSVCVKLFFCLGNECISGAWKSSVTCGGIPDGGGEVHRMEF